KDAYGNQMLKMTYEFTEQDRNLHKYLSYRSAEIIAEMNADIIEKNVISDHYDIVLHQSTHNTGGVPMGDDPNISAVNNYSQLWDMEYLFVIGASAFAHNGGYTPTGVVGAFAYRPSEGILDYLDGDGGMLVEAKNNKKMA